MALSRCDTTTSTSLLSALAVAAFVLLVSLPILVLLLPSVSFLFRLFLLRPPAALAERKSPGYKETSFM